MKSLRVSMSFTAASLALCLFASVAHAQPSEDPASGFEALPLITAVPLEHRGTPGLWIPEGMSREIQADIEELRRLRVVAERQEGKIELSGERISNMLTMLELLRQEREFAVDALDEAIKGRREAEEAKDAWYRSPELWVTVGVVAGAALILVAAELVPAARTN